MLAVVVGQKNISAPEKLKSTTSPESGVIVQAVPKRSPLGEITPKPLAIKLFNKCIVLLCQAVGAIAAADSNSAGFYYSEPYVLIARKSAPVGFW